MTIYSNFRCTRLNLISLAYLWRRDQTELLQEMIDCQLDAIIIKVKSQLLSLSRANFSSSKFLLPIGRFIGPNARSTFGKVNQRYARSPGEDAREVRCKCLR